MQESSGTQVPSSINVPAVRFDANADFQKRSINHERDSNFTRLPRKSWVRSSGDRRCNREALTTLLSSHGDNSSECIEKLLTEEISYRDLASLSNFDLELIGFKNAKERDDLIAFFTELPNQDPTYKDICDMPEAKMYNREILGNAIDHLENMRSALSAANYKLKIMPPEDIVVGEKSFASRFVLEALAELKTATTEIDKEVEDLSKLIDDKSSLVATNKSSKKFSYSSFGICTLICTIAAVGALATIYLPKVIKN